MSLHNVSGVDPGVHAGDDLFVVLAVLVEYLVLINRTPAVPNNTRKRVLQRPAQGCQSMIVADGLRRVG